MLVCHCRAVSDLEIVEVVEAGAYDADAVAAVCGAGGACGGCRVMVERLVEIHGTTSTVLVA